MIFKKAKRKTKKNPQRQQKLGGGFKYFLFSSLPGEGSHFDYYFSKGLKPPTTKIPATSENLFKDGIEKEYSGPSKGGTKPPENSPLGTVNKMKKKASSDVPTFTCSSLLVKFRVV